MTYARALMTMEELRLLPEGLAMAVAGGPLLRRIRRILNQDQTRELRSGTWLAGGLMLLLWTGILFGVQQGLRAGPESAPANDRSQVEAKWEATLKTGVHVEMASVASRNALTNWVFWKPNGTVIAPLYRLKEYYRYDSDMHGPGNLFEFTVRLRHLPSTDCRVKWRSQPIVISEDLRGHTWSAKQDSAFWTGFAHLSQIPNTCTVSVGVASGSWTNRLRIGPGGTVASGPLGLMASPMVETAGQTMVVITVNPDQDDYRLVAADAEGQVISPARTEQVSEVGGVRQHTLYFGWPPSRIRNFRLQTRPYEWVEFKDVRVRPFADPNKPSSRLQFRWVAKDDDAVPVDELDDPTNSGRKLRVLKEVVMDESMVASAAVSTNMLYTTLRWRWCSRLRDRTSSVA